MRDTENGNKVAKDTGYITFNGKSYKVNQSGPSIDFVNKISKLITFNSTYTNLSKSIVLLQEKIDKEWEDAGSKDIELTLKETERLEALKISQDEKMSTLLEGIDDMIDTCLSFFLTPDVASNFDDTGFIEKLQLVNDCVLENKHTKLSAKHALANQ